MWRAARLAAFAAIGAAAVDATAAPAAEGVAPKADGPDGLALDVVGACPDGAEVRRLLAGLVSPDEARAAPVSIQDRGRHFRIAVREQATTLDDPSRDCGARARQAAVVAANDLQPHRVVLGPPTWTVEKGVVFDVAPGAAGTPWAPGAEIRGAVGSGPWSLVGAAGARGPATLSLDHDSKAELLRFPVDVGTRLTSYRWRLRPWFTAGGSLTLNGIQGQDLVQTNREWRVDLGAFAMVGATLRVFKRLGGAAALSVRWQPWPYRLHVVPLGAVGETPAWWFGLSLNYTLDGKGSSPP
jgi:hypothetical protein